MAFSEIEKLQEAVARRLLSIGDFAVADIAMESAKAPAIKTASACGVRITVKIPMPQSASKYAAGPVFSKVNLQILIERDDSAAKHSPSICAIAESATRALHNWIAPAECGYGKVQIAQTSPWARAETKSANLSALVLNFTTQSVLG
ncbi:MAG: hypothetical protein IKO42_06910 [Opitutales bacterium]|nr:hypothetical protein [Opitutales bacterium]